MLVETDSTITTSQKRHPVEQQARIKLLSRIEGSLLHGNVPLQRQLQEKVRNGLVEQEATGRHNFELFSQVVEQLLEEDISQELISETGHARVTLVIAKVTDTKRKCILSLELMRDGKKRPPRENSLIPHQRVVVEYDVIPTFAGQLTGTSSDLNAKLRVVIGERAWTFPLTGDGNDVVNYERFADLALQVISDTRAERNQDVTSIQDFLRDQSKIKLAPKYYEQADKYVDFLDNCYFILLHKLVGGVALMNANLPEKRWQIPKTKPDGKNVDAVLRCLNQGLSQQVDFYLTAHDEPIEDSQLPLYSIEYRSYAGEVVIIVKFLQDKQTQTAVRISGKSVIDHDSPDGTKNTWYYHTSTHQNYDLPDPDMMLLELSDLIGLIGTIPVDKTAPLLP